MTRTKSKPKGVTHSESAEVLPPAASSESLSVVPPTDIDENEEILSKQIRCTDTGIIIDGELPFQKWVRGFDFFQKVGSKTQWWRGDMLIYGEKHFGESYAQAVDIHGKSESRLATYVYVCNKFPMERRRPELSFDHHAECASLEAREADALLLRAIRERWTKMDVRAETARINERNGVPKRGRKPTGTAAKVAASGKTPQIALIEAEKPLIWNGYPLSVMVMPDQTRVILQGSEPLPTDEADRAAHHFKHAHGPALASWLEEHNFRKEPNGANPPNMPEVREPVPQIDQRPTAGVQAMSDAPTWGGNPVTTKNGLLWVGTEWLNANAADDCAIAHGFTCAELMVKALEARNSPQPEAPAPAQPAPEPVAAPVEPNAQPEPPAGSDDEATKAIILDTLQQIGEPLWNLDADCRIVDAVDYLRDRIIAMGKERDDAREQLKRYDIHAAAETPIEAAERHIRAFNLASENVDWKAIGESELLRKKWLGSLLRKADEAIDLIQKQPVTPRK